MDNNNGGSSPMISSPQMVSPKLVDKNSQISNNYSFNQKPNKEINSFDRQRQAQDVASGIH